MTNKRDQLIEAAARAMFPQRFSEYKPDYHGKRAMYDHLQREALRNADAAWIAFAAKLREPSEGMVEAAMVKWGSSAQKSPFTAEARREVFIAMLDAVEAERREVEGG